MTKHKILSSDFNFEAISAMRDESEDAFDTHKPPKLNKNQTDKTNSSPLKKAVRPITYRRLYNITLYYLSRFDSSTGKVRDMLKRRLLRTQMKGGEIPQEASDWIDQIVARMVELQYIDDRRYGENQIRQLSAQGKSTRFIAMKLAAAGLDSDTVQELLETSPHDEMSRALKLVRRKKMGYLRDESVRTDFYKKDLTTLGRAGFSYETAVKALNGDEDY